MGSDSKYDYVSEKYLAYQEYFSVDLIGIIIRKKLKRKLKRKQ